MNARLEFGILAGLLLVSAVVSWTGMTSYYNRVNTPEVVAQKKVNAALQEDLCDRLNTDLAHFKANPNTFRRVRLPTIESESRQSLRHLLVADGVPKDFPLEYRGGQSRFATCEPALKRWFALPASTQDGLDEERKLAGLSADGTAQQQSRSPKSDPVALRGSRVALVIGNAKYQNRPLRNPENDAEDVAAMLSELGFDVVKLRNGSTNDMRSAIDEYVRKLRTSDVGVVYFSGHGVEYAGRNYLLPVDFNANDEDEIPRQATDLTILVDKLSKAHGKINILVVDACRSSYLVSRTRDANQGLATMSPVNGTIVAFSTAPGRVAEDGDGRNSPYTKSFLRALRKPGLKVEDVFKETARLVEVETAGRQQPWYTSSLVSDFSLR